MPLLYDGAVVGLLDIQSDKTNAFTADERFMFEAVADNIAIAIHNAALYRSEQWRRQGADGLREVAGLISANADVNDVLEVILSELDRSLPVDISAIWLLDGDELYLAASHNCDEDVLEQALYGSQDSYDALMQVIHSEGAQVRKPTDGIWVSGIAGGFDQNYSALAVPLRVGDQPFGAITLAHHTPGRYGSEAQTIATTFASYAAVAIENTRLYDVALEQAYASAALLQVAYALADSHGVALVGGDTVRGPRVVTITVLGFVEPQFALRRDGARPGDVLFVSGWPGEAGAGLEALRNVTSPGADDPLVRRYRYAEPRIALGRALRGRASAAMDVSDGLFGDLQKLCKASGVGARLDLVVDMGPPLLLLCPPAGEDRGTVEDSIGEYREDLAELLRQAAARKAQA